MITQNTVDFDLDNANRLLGELAEADSDNQAYPNDYMENHLHNIETVEPKAKPKKSKVEASRKPVLLDLSTVKPTPIKWLWPGRFAKGRLSLLVGRAGLGKSFLTIDLAMRVTTGFGWPDGTDSPTGSVLFVACEDDPADTIRPRLDAAGADPSKVRLLRAVNAIDPKSGKLREVPFTLQDVSALEHALDSMEDCQLVVIDPIGSYLGGGTDSHRDNEVRGVLAPVAALAEKYDVAVVIVAHTRKSTAQYADDTALGSRAFTGIVRTSWHLMEYSDDKELRLLLPGKNNLSQVAPGLAYRIKTNEMVPVKTGRVVWEPGTIDRHADDVLAELNEQSKPGPVPESRSEAEGFLREVLTDGPRLAKEVKKEARDAGISNSTLMRAKAEVGVILSRNGDGWEWSLPSEASAQDPSQNLRT